jgi:tetratricopeptide (TPR) repeat protein
VIEGSVQPSGEKMRVNAQLIDAESGAHLFADQFDTPRADLLQTQDAIVRHLANTLAFQLFQAEGARLKRTPAANRDAEDLALQCSAGQWKAGPIGKEADAAYAPCEQALAIDPNNVRALTTSGWKLLVPALLGVSADPKGDIERADELVSKALALDPDYPFARDQKGWVRLGEGRDGEAVPEFERAVALDPSDPDPNSGLGWVHLRLGEFDKSIESFDKAISMSPYDPGLAFWYAGKMSANFGLKRYDQAIEPARQSIAINPNYVNYTHTTLVAALALTGHVAEAREALQRYLALPSTGNPKTSAAVKEHDESQHWVTPEMGERTYDGLRKAGMPEGEAKTN